MGKNKRTDEQRKKIKEAFKTRKENQKVIQDYMHELGFKEVDNSDSVTTLSQVDRKDSLGI